MLLLKLVAATGRPCGPDQRAAPVHRGPGAWLATCRSQDPTVSRQPRRARSSPGPGCGCATWARPTAPIVDGERVIDGAGHARRAGRLRQGRLRGAGEAEPPAPARRTSGGEGSLDATILRQVPVRGRPDIASQLADAPAGLLAAHASAASPREDRQARKLDLLLDIAKELSQQTEVDRLLDKVVGLTFQVMSVDRVAILTWPRTAASWCRGSRRSRVGGAGRRAGRCRAPSPARRWRSGWRCSRERRRTALRRRPVVLQQVAERPLRAAAGRARGRCSASSISTTWGPPTPSARRISSSSPPSPAWRRWRSRTASSIERMRREAVVLSNFQRYFAPDLARADRRPGGGDPARRRQAAGGGALLRHPRLHLAVGADEPGRDRQPADRVLHRDGGDRLRARRHARQVHGRRADGALGGADRPRRRRRPRHPGGDRHAAGARRGSTSAGGARGGRRCRSGSASTPARSSPATSAASGGWSTR